MFGQIVLMENHPHSLVSLSNLDNNLATRCESIKFFRTQSSFIESPGAPLEHIL